MNMKFLASIFCLVLVVNITTSNREPFEPPHLNLTEALTENGIDVSTIPALSDVLPVSDQRLRACCKTIPPLMR